MRYASSAMGLSVGGSGGCGWFWGSFASARKAVRLWWNCRRLGQVTVRSRASILCKLEENLVTRN